MRYPLLAQGSDFGADSHSRRQSQMQRLLGQAPSLTSLLSTMNLATISRSEMCSGLELYLAS